MFVIFSDQALALRCGRRIVDIGDKKPKVLSRCGEPMYMETRERKFPSHCIDRGMSINEYYDINGYNRYQNQRGYDYPPICNVEIIDVWTYNFGPRKLMRELFFRDGILKKIDTIGYGN